ncbi:unnamed protein product [Paramecium sonneborni]|uniref:EGF-like domain-containing protein n=1 Tax=Paramecium sonneborni TaxID=65129 RepID=A0A8S1R071_9CILI|nr:unnamed protein product [Paramecium sonneborni]
MKILVFFFAKVFIGTKDIYVVMNQSYKLVQQDIINTGAHTWIDETSAALSLTGTLCSSLKQPFVTISSHLAKSISNQYIVTNNDHEIYIKVIVAGTWEGDSFVIKSGTTTLLTQSLTTATQLNEVYCTLSNVKVMVFQVVALKTSLITSGSDKLLKLILSIPTLNDAAKTKTIYVGPVLIYEIGTSVGSSNIYVANQQYNYFTSLVQNPNTVLGRFSYSTINSIASQKYDLLTFGITKANFIIGGYRRWNQGIITFSQTLQVHYKIKFSFYIYAFDTQIKLTSTNLIIKVNGASGLIVLPETSINRIQAGNLYGNNGMDSVYFIEYEVDHINTNLQITIELTDTIDMGITNFQLISKNCPQFCQSCYSEGTCDACSSVDNRNQVTCQCNEQYYEDLVNFICKPCDYRCAKCLYDPIDTKGTCLLCKYGFDINTKCSTCLYSYQFENKIAIKCENCQSCCLTCSGPTDRDCITFKKPYMIMPDNQAVLSCPSNFIIIQQTIDRTLCVICDLSCKTCVDTPSKCLTCYDGYELLFNQCLLSCPISTYRLNKDCTPCSDPVCQTCTESQCLMCLPNTFMSRISKLCISPCDTGYYSELTTRTCRKCHQTCKECSNPLFTQCSTCPDNTYMNMLQNLPEGYYPSGKFCEPCFSGCRFCSAITICQTCIAGFFLYNNFCVETCPSNMYPNQFVQKCLNCNQACNECTGGENYQCLTCSGGLQQYQGKCYTVCPLGTIGVNGICQSCTFNCDVCVGTNVYDCTQCSEQKFILNGQCYDICPPSYQADLTTFKCEFCIDNCEACIQSTCHLCLSGYFYQNGLCYTQCFDGFYKQNNQRRCQPCNLVCKTCFGPDIDECLTCPNSYYFYYNNCLPECPEGFYAATGRICTPCHQTCLTCLSPLINHCVTCPITSYLYQQKCIPSCPSGTYTSYTFQSCIERMRCVTDCSPGYTLNGIECETLLLVPITCDPQCLTCALQSSNCLTCQPSRQQNKPQCTCIKGFYDVGAPLCLPCQHQCSTCKVQSNNCQTCKGNRYGSTCSCPDYYYEDGVSLNCPKCNYKCEFCQNNVCTTCADRRINLPTCICPDGFFDDLTPTCQGCSIVCKTCVDVADKCVICSGIRENAPYCTCPSGYFDFQGQCLKCQFECVECDSNGCLSCQGNMSGPFVGKCICKDGYSRKSIGSVYCTNCDMGVAYSLLKSGLNKIKIDFGGPLDLVDETKTGCDEYFQTSTVSTLGSNASCSIDENAIIVTLGKYATIDIGHTFAFGSGFKLKICSSSFIAYKQSNLILDPSTSNEENLPYITFMAQQPKTTCEAVIIKFNIGNTGNRNFNIYSWELTQPVDYVNVELNTILSSITPAKTFDNQITIPKLILKPYTTFGFNIQLRNFLGLDGQNTIFIQTLGPAQISIQEPEEQNTFYRYETMLLNFTFVYSNCTLTSEMTEKINIIISLGSRLLSEQSERYILQMSSSFDIQIPIDPYILKVGSNNISVTITVPSQSISKNIHMNQEIAEGTLVVKIKGGNRQVGDVAIVILNASAIDQDIDPKENDEFQYEFSWTCFDVLKGADCLDLYGNSLKYPNGKSVVIQASELTQYNSYVFKAETKKGNKQASGKSMIQIVEVDVPQLQSSDEKQEAKIIQSIFNYYDEIQLSFQYTSTNPDNLFYSATIIYDQVSVKSFKFYSLTFKFRLIDYFTKLNVIQSNQITLRISVYNPIFVMPSLRSIVITYNLPPNNCQLIFNNPDSIIYEFKTYVNITITDCEDDDLPLQYKLLFYNDKDTYDYDLTIGKFINNINILDFQSNNTLLFQLPYVGPQQSINYTSYLLFMIKDQMNGISNITSPIIITNNFDINQSSMGKLLDDAHNLQDTLYIQDLIVNRVIQMDNYSSFKYDLIRKNDLIAQEDLPIDQQNTILNQMIQLINDKEVSSQFLIQLNSLNNFNKTIQSNLLQFKTLQQDSQTTLQQQNYIKNYHKYFDLFSSLISNSENFNTTNDQLLKYIEIIKTQLIDLTILNSDGFNIQNDQAILQVKKASYKVINELTGNILKKEQVFRLLESNQEQSNFQYFFNKFIANPYLNEETFPKNYSFGAETIYLRVVDENTQLNAIMLQPFSYTFIVNDTYANNQTICIQKLFDIWTSKDIQTTLINKTAISCQILLFNPFTIVINSTFSNNTNSTETPTDQEDETDEQNQNQQNEQNQQTNNNQNQTSNINNTPNTLLISELFFIYLILIGSLILLLTFYAHYKDTQFAKVYIHKKSESEIVRANQKSETPEIKKGQIFTYKEKHNQNEQTITTSQSNIQRLSTFQKFKLITLNFHTLISIFYRDEAYRKITYFNYVIRFFFIQLSIFISYIYFTFDYQLALVFLFSPFVFSIYTFLMNIPVENKLYIGLKIVMTILSLFIIGLSIYRVVDFIINGNEYNLNKITYFLMGSIGYDNLVYNMIIIMIIFLMTIKEGGISLKILKFMQKCDQEQIMLYQSNVDAIKQQ